MELEPSQSSVSTFLASANLDTPGVSFGQLDMPESGIDEIETAARQLLDKHGYTAVIVSTKHGYFIVDSNQSIPFGESADALSALLD